MKISILRQTLLLLALITVVACFKIDDNQKLSFEPTPYDKTTSRKYAAFSSITHCDRSCIQSWNCKTILEYPKLINVTYLENSVTKASGFIGYDPNAQTIVTSWRGSSNAQNWIQDFNFEMVPYLSCIGCQIHAGFWVDFKSNQKFLNTAAQTIVKNFKVTKIVCTGQSLGGAISTINGIQFVHKFPHIPIQVHNFGSPRIGNAKLAQYLKSKIPTIYRVVHYKDLVPHVPFEAMQYRHPAYQVFFDESMSTYKICSESGQDSSCSNQFFPNFDTNDHDFYFMHIGSPKC